MKQVEALKVKRKEAKQQTARRSEIRTELQKGILWLATPFKNASEGKKLSLVTTAESEIEMRQITNQSRNFSFKIVFMK